ncbi:MAG TPA: TolC family protein [Puia sp.]|nr:TolC family protein [Puia sp.]
MRKYMYIPWMVFVCLLSLAGYGQRQGDSLLQDATLQNCVQYALQHQPLIQQSYLDETITERQIKDKLSEWYPQIGLSLNAIHYFQLPVFIFQGTATPSGVYNTHYGSLTLNQNIFDRDVLLASRSKKDVLLQSKQNTTSNKIDITVNVSKAYYDILLTQKQIELLDEDIVRLARSLKDSYNQYQGGIVDKTDYKRATIALNNSKAERKTYEELLKSKWIYLRQLMNYPATGPLELKYDSMQMEHEILMDTTQNANVENRIEFQQLKTQQRLMVDNLKYYKWAYIPSLALVGNYSINFYNNNLTDLYAKDFPSSYLGLALNVPIFQGTKRTQEIKIAQLQLQRLDYDLVTLKNAVNSQYAQALAVYKGNLNDYYILRDNLELARDVYNTIQLQYKSGVKTYLDLITAETDIRSAQVNYANALFQVLSSKLDVQKALGSITY